jgi:alanine dehydrogenase
VTGALISDEQYEQAGATLGEPGAADVVDKVNPPTRTEIGVLSSGSALFDRTRPVPHGEAHHGLLALARIRPAGRFQRSRGKDFVRLPRTQIPPRTLL